MKNNKSMIIQVIAFLIAFILLIIGAVTGKVMLLCASTFLFGVSTWQTINGINMNMPLLPNLNSAFSALSRIFFMVSVIINIYAISKIIRR